MSVNSYAVGKSTGRQLLSVLKTPYAVATISSRGDRPTFLWASSDDIWVATSQGLSMLDDPENSGDTHVTLSDVLSASTYLVLPSSLSFILLGACRSSRTVRKQPWQVNSGGAVDREAKW